MRKRCDSCAADEVFFEHSPAAPVGGKAAVLLTGMRTKASWFFVKDNARERGNSVWTAETGYGKMGNTVRV